MQHPHPEDETTKHTNHTKKNRESFSIARREVANGTAYFPIEKASYKVQSGTLGEFDRTEFNKSSEGFV
jgi:hypothetical protein